MGNKTYSKTGRSLLATMMAFSVLSSPITWKTISAEEAPSSDVKLRIMGTSDIHNNIYNYDYYKDTTTDEFGLAKTATLIKKARAEVPATNSLLFDSGDLIQGNPMGDYVAKIKPLQEGEEHPTVKAFELLGYDGAAIGNHEFNYGLEYLDEVIDDANYPIINANVYHDDKDADAENDKQFNEKIKNYEILEREVTDEAGNKHKIKVGIVGFVPPQIMQWDQAHLDGKVIAKDIKKTAEKMIPKMKAEGADIIVALSHSGLGDAEYIEGEENAAYQLSQIEGVDAILIGHDHKTFPSAAYKGDGIDNVNGTINGKPAVMPGSWGSHLGIMDLTLAQVDGKWKVKSGGASVRAIFKKETVNGKSVITSLADADQAILDSAKHEHEGTLDYVRKPVGTTSADIHSFFSLVKDDPSIQIVTNAQKWYLEKKLKGTKNEGLPILSAGAPFKAGGRGGASYYTDIKKGQIAIKNVNDLYLYPNTVAHVKITGADVKEWLEMSAGQFNTIDPAKTEEQPLINNDFPTYNFDVLDGVTYEVDVTKPAKYDKDGKVINAESSRIKDLKYNGKEIDPKQEFIVATNNYRAGSNSFPGVKNKKEVELYPDENRNVIVDYIAEKGNIDPSADSNWKLSSVKGKTNITFESSESAKELVDPNMKYVGTQESGFAKYALDLAPAPIVFKDVPKTHWAAEAIYALAEDGIVSGISKDKYGPSQQMSRVQFVAIISRALKLPESNEPLPFKDVPGWAKKDVAAAYAAGLVAGTSKDKFGPNVKLTREQMVTMLVRAYEYRIGEKLTASKPATFKDMGSVASYAKEAVAIATELGLINGFEGNRFAPKDKTNRAQGAVVLYNMLNKAKESDARTVSVQLLGINDFHGQLMLKNYKMVGGKPAGGAEYLAAYMRQRESQNPNTLMVNAGDSVGASAPISALLQDEPTIDIFNKLGFDVSTVGNHEFDEGVPEMMRLINGGWHKETGHFEGADFPFVAANVHTKKTGKLLLDPYVVKEVGGVKVGFIGVVTTDTPNIVIPSALAGITFSDEAEAINKYAAELKEKGVKSIVVLAHNPATSNPDGTNPLGEVVEMAKTIDDEVDVLYAGHNHQYTNTVVDNKLIVQSFSSGTAFSDVDLEINVKTKDIVKKSAEIVTTWHEGITPDAEIKSIVEAAYEQVKPILEEEIGKTDAAISKTQTVDGESAMGNLIADSMKAHTGTDFAFMNPGGVRADINAGPITWEEVFTVQPFGNDLVTMDLTGQQIKDLLGQQWISGREKILQISGLKFTFESTADAAGKYTGKVVDITLPNGSALDLTKTYSVTVNNFMAGGGDGYSALLGGKNVTVNITDLDALIKYIKAQGTVNPVVEGRTTKLNK